MNRERSKKSGGDLREEERREGGKEEKREGERRKTREKKEEEKKKLKIQEVVGEEAEISYLTYSGIARDHRYLNQPKPAQSHACSRSPMVQYAKGTTLLWLTYIHPSAMPDRRASEIATSRLLLCIEFASVPMSVSIYSRQRKPAALTRGPWRHPELTSTIGIPYRTRT
jgi:hypothetical protein